MTIHYAGHGVTVHAGDCLDVLTELGDNTVDSVVTDPPYGLEFMGKEWDSFKTYAGGNPNMKPQASTANGSPLSYARPDSAPIASHGMRQKNPRCRRCGKLMRGNGSCKCPEPQPDTRTAEGANQYQFWCEDWATECLRVLKPGGHLLAFGGTRTSHRLATAIEDAGFEIRDSIVWLYGSGFPKSLDVGKALDRRGGAVADFTEFRDACRAAMRERGVKTKDVSEALGNFMASHYFTGGSQPAVPNVRDYRIIRDLLGLGDRFDALFAAEAEREVVGHNPNNRDTSLRTVDDVMGQATGGKLLTAPATDAAAQWQGWGTALKPAHEPIVVARKPLAGTVAATVLAHGTGALNIDGCRVEGVPHCGGAHGVTIYGSNGNYTPGPNAPGNPAGRWPANVVLSHADDCGEVVCAGGCPVATLDAQSGPSASPTGVVTGKGTAFTRAFQASQGYRPDGEKYANEGPVEGVGYGDSGGASRFFYTSKASTAERVRLDGPAHPTVKPLDLMRWLVRLVTPPKVTTLVCSECEQDVPRVPAGLQAKAPRAGDSETPADAFRVPPLRGTDAELREPLACPNCGAGLTRVERPGLILDPFAGSGTTAEAALLEGFRCITIEREPDYLPLIVQRVNRRRDPVAATRAAPDGPSLFDLLEGGDV